MLVPTDTRCDDALLADRFHETGGHGTGDLFVDSPFGFDRTRSGIMAGWRQVIELAMTDEEIGRLAVIARSRSEPASRVERAQMLLAYRQKPSFFAVGQELGQHHQTVQRCVERALAYGPLAALDDRPRPGGQGLVGVFGVRQGQGSWLSARVVDDAAAGTPCARERTGGGTRMSLQPGPGHGVQDTRPRGDRAAIQPNLATRDCSRASCEIPAYIRRRGWRATA
jgi:hypothetical protein